LELGAWSYPFGAALGGGLDTFFGTPGAIGAVLNVFTLSLGVSGLVAWLSPAAEGGREALSPFTGSTPFVVLLSIVVVAASAVTIALYNVITGNSQGFVGEFGSLALSLALISATLDLVTAPIRAPTGLHRTR
jgi:hypothetical protein